MSTLKKAYAFYIVDNGCAYEADLSTDAFAAQLEKETIKIPGKEKKKLSVHFADIPPGKI